MVEVPVKIYLERLLKVARSAARPLSSVSGKTKAEALHRLGDRLEQDEEQILVANREDVERVGKSLDPETLRERLKEVVERISLSSEDVIALAEGLRSLADFPDPVGEVTGMWSRPNGMHVSRVRVPIGVIGVISDLGPKVDIESMALCLKSGNVCVLRSHSDWSRTNQVIFAGLKDVAQQVGLPPGSVCLIERSEQEAALELLKFHKYVDAVIPRGGPNLRKIVAQQAKMPVLCHDLGVSFVFVDGNADLPIAQNVVVNAKAQDPSATNAVDTVLVHQDIARAFLSGLIRRLLDDYTIEVRCCPKTMAIIGDHAFSSYSSTVPAKDEDWGKQFLSRALAVKIVGDMDEAMDHIAHNGPGHTAAIITRDYDAAMRFAREVDASLVAINASTRLNEAQELGYSGQMGISTGRIHARGPVSLEELTCQKYVIMGNGQLKQPHPVSVPYEDAIMLKRQ